ncbi:MAG: hypothetical protein IKK75_10675, partial [Clostridia bacterium]|nr:hypothetical protein [Clostridia bacterium]
MKKLLSLVLALAMLLSMAVSATAAEITDLKTYEIASSELETWNIHSSQAAQDLNVLVNLIDGLLTNDPAGALVGNAAKEWSTEDGGKTWKFVLNDGMKWHDKDGNVMADVVAQDWLTGLEWVLNYAKNGAANTSMPIEMIVGAKEYYDYTKQLAEEQGEEAALALGLEKFSEMVKVTAPDEKTIIYECVDQLAYFPSVATYNCLYPLSAKLIEAIGVQGYQDVTWENMWYSGPYTITEFIHQNQKVFTKNPNYYNKDIKCFNTVTVKMVESADVAFNYFQTGELDHVSLSQSNLTNIYNNKGNEWNPYLVEARPTKYSYQIHLVYDKN